MADLSKEWCEVRIEYYEYEAANGLPVTREHYAKHAQALRIAARVLDEGAVERAKDELSKHIRVDAAGLAPAVVQHFVIGLDEAAQAVINYLLEGKE